VKAFWRHSRLHEGHRWTILDTLGSLVVLERRDSRGLLMRRLMDGELIQNTYDPEARRSLSAFTGALVMLARAYAPRLRTALCLGLGAGFVPRQLAAVGAEVVAVDNNPHMGKVASRHFDFNPDCADVVVADGRDYLEQHEARYDAILLDAFIGDAPPPRLITAEAFALMRRRLLPEGILVINSFGEHTAKFRAQAASIGLTLREVFRAEGIRVHASGRGNVYFVATAQPPLEVARSPNVRDEHPSLRFELNLVWNGLRLLDSRQGTVLADTVTGN
tara:strand:- start:126 stop:953 length:828 start_codon:yes stop_codon:yes gene_type:complete